MNRLFKTVAALVCAFGLTALSQAQMTTITASSIKMGGKTIAAGTVTFTPVNLAGIPIAFEQGGGGLNSPDAYSCTIVAGVITGTCQIPDAALTSTPNLLYSIQITNTASQRAFTMPAVPNITGSNWALDAYAPPAQTTNVEPIQVSYGTTAPPSPCVSPSFYVQNLDGGLLFMCVGGGPVLVTGSGTGSGGVGPVGPAGPTGATGPAGLNNRGLYSSTSTYNVSDLVSYLSSAYVCVVNGTTGSPFSAPSNWTLLVSEGPQGPTGATGPQGPAGSGGGSVTYGTTANTAAEGNDSRIVGAVQTANNLSDLNNAAAARTNLGLGSAATQPSTAFDAAGSAATAATAAATAQATANAAQPISAKGQPNGYASLDSNGLLPSSQLPPIAIDQTFVVTSQSAMLALAATIGDVAIRSDINTTYILQNSPASTLANWQQVLTPASPVQSVNGQTGIVNLAFSNLAGSAAATQMPALTGDCTTSAGAVSVTCGPSVARTGADINTSNQVTATHLAAPLPVSQGGNATANPAFSTLTDSSSVTWAVGSALIGSSTLTLAHTTPTRVINLTGLINGGYYSIELKQDTTGGAAATLGAGCTWFQGGSAGFTASTTLALTTTANAFNVLAFFYDGTNCIANLR